MNLLALSLEHFLLLGALLFALGIFGAVTRRSAIGILMSIELMFNGVNITLVALNHYLWSGQLTGQIFVIFSVTVAAAEAAVGLALVIAAYRTFKTAMADEISLLSDGFAMMLPSFAKLTAPDVPENAPLHGGHAHHTDDGDEGEAKSGPAGNHGGGHGH